MDAPYSFYCSRCKKDHPGECPPEVVKLVTNKMNDAEFFDFFSKKSQPAPAPSPAPWPGMVGRSPKVGSRWMSEIQSSATGGTWKKANGPYEVVGVVGDQVTIQWVGGSQQYPYHADCWTSAGTDRGSGIRLRFVPAP